MPIVNSTVIRKLSLLVIVVGTMNGCKEKVESNYPSVAIAVKDGAFDRGWLPELLKPDVVNIWEWHDIASNEVRGRFALNERVLNRLQSTCKPAVDAPRKSWSMPDWFPESIPHGVAEAHGMRIFRCDNFFIAADAATEAGYFWEADYPRK
jgi:hypothetical protein